MQNIQLKNAKPQCNIAIITARFNLPVTQKLYEAAKNRLAELQFPEEMVTSIWVPGCVEIPLVAKRLAKSKNYQAIVALGAVIRGETDHYDYVCDQVSQGCQKVMLDHEIPVIFGVLTTENAEQAFARATGAHSSKGKEAIDCALEMVAVIEAIT